MSGLTGVVPYCIVFQYNDTIPDILGFSWSQHLAVTERSPECLSHGRPDVSSHITALQLKSLKPGKWISDPASRGAGCLEARKLMSGEVAFYFRYTNSNGKRSRILLGTAKTLAEARKSATDLSKKYQSGDKDLSAVLNAEREAARQQRLVSQKAAAAAKMSTLGMLLTAYADQLETDKKPSAKAVRSSFSRHIKSPLPSLWKKALNDVDTGELADLLRPLVSQGKRREAAKLRSYLKAAYAMGIRAPHDALISSHFANIKVSHNPARDLGTVDGSSNYKERALSSDELRAYWHRIRDSEEPIDLLMVVHLLTGGQRLEQLSRLKDSDIDISDRTITLLDSKGRRKKPRKHVVPLVPRAMSAIEKLRTPAAGEHLFSLSKGYQPASSSTICRHLRGIVQNMLGTNELSDGPFTAGDIRRTVETRLAELGISREVRAQLQSHELGGIQMRHYDKYDYLKEKRQALEALYALLEG